MRAARATDVHLDFLDDDYHLIQDLAGRSGPEILQMMRRIADDAAHFIEAEPGKRLTGPCGRTHTSAEYRPPANLELLIGGAEYGRPEISRIPSID
jgi:hypothetical protein